MASPTPAAPATGRGSRAVLPTTLLTIAVLAGAGLLAGTSSERGDTRQQPAVGAPLPDYGRLSGSSLYATREQLTRGWKTDFSRRAVPLSEFQRGGPGRDGIAAVDDPLLRPAGAEGPLELAEPVVEVVVGDVARAYPLGLLLQHEIVNDTIARVPVVVTFCPLCNTALVFDRRVGGRTLSFGATGSLREADLVMYDRQTESWWQQFGGRGLVGRYTGARLRRLPSRVVELGVFAAEHPEGMLAVSRQDPGLVYGKNPYLGTLDPRQPAPFPASGEHDRRLAPSERVVFVERRGDAVAIPVSALDDGAPMTVDVGGTRLIVRRTGATAEVRDGEGRLVPFAEPFWFAVASFRPTVVVVRP